MILSSSIIVKFVFIFLIVFSCIQCFQSDSNSDEDTILSDNQSSPKKHCTKANSTFGERELDDMEVEVFNVDKPKSWWWFGKVSHQIWFNRTSSKPNNTTFIEFINKDEYCDCYANEIILVDGGIHQYHVNINIISERGCPLKYVVKCSAK